MNTMDHKHYHQNNIKNSKRPSYHSVPSLHIGTDLGLLASRSFGGHAHFFQQSFGVPKGIGDITGHFFNLSFHIVEIFTKHTPDASGVHGMQLIHLALNISQDFVDGIDIGDPRRGCGIVTDATSGFETRHLNASLLLMMDWLLIGE